jgi:pyridoxamine 5'-phosphate oxidase
MNQEELQNLRQDYGSASLSETTININPIKQFETWFNEALEAKIHAPNAMTLATATTDGRPSSRIVLLKGFDNNGFVFYTNYLSRKGKEITKNPLGAINFFWSEMERQVRIEGTIEKLSKEQSENYFHSRPKTSQISAVASPQSQEIADRELLENKITQLESEYVDKTIPKPSFWGGYILRPRLFKKIDNKNWKKVRLAP